LAGSVSLGYYDGMAAEPDPTKKEENVWVQVARYSEVAFALPAGTVAGWLLGSGLDRWLHTGWLSIVGLVLGTVAGFIEVIRTVSKSGSK
jgi:F0F1-type ATP synthase assembly protein I